ncbi:hypothetical protein E2C01_096545 [Portunus trituberculatus]|uniref:Uncharacterized protein n=1 Tax=Portunus trituberculatus TaxID=210409 RepID=A0A5B7JY76_PORTR|nr:hypothetical protein [Portunus trituberculatus]
MILFGNAALTPSPSSSSSSSSPVSQTTLSPHTLHDAALTTPVSDIFLPPALHPLLLCESTATL